LLFKDKRQRIDEKRADEIVKQTIADMSFSGFVCDDKDIEAMYRIARREATAGYEVRKVIKEFKAKRRQEKSKKKTR
jgi:hypothetical protein